MGNLLVTGAGGFIAGSCIVQCGDETRLHAISRGAALIERDNLTWHSIDPLDRESLGAVLRSSAIEAVIHTAAIASIDYCEAHPAEAHCVNVALTEQLAEFCTESGAKLVFLSTDNVFDGTRGGYAESDEAAPLHVYGETKLEAERIVSQSTNPWVVARVAIVMGLPMLGAGNSFVVRMLPRLENNEPVYVPPAEIRSPVDVATLGRALLELATNDFTGVIHLAGNDVVPRVEMARRIVEKMKYPPELVVPRDPGDIPGRAPRPADVSLDNTRARRVLNTPMKGLDEGIDSFLSAAGR